MLNRNPLQVASLLISEPFMLDPNFQRSVILLAAHDKEEGTLGYVLNQQSNLIISDILPEIADDLHIPVYLGGPVGLDTVNFVHQCADRLSESVDLGNGLHIGGSLEHAVELLSDGMIQKQEIKFFIGYSGWNPNQLEGELKENSWVICNDYHPDLVLIEEGENVWKEALIAMGPKYAHVANFPINPQWN